MVQVGFKTDKGKKRKNNEDSLFVIPEYKTYIVADGVGGHNSGEIASRTAVSSIAEYIKSNPFDEIYEEEYLREYFLTCLKHVNEKIYKISLENRQHSGMATTIVILFIKDGKAYIINVGDSRAYIIRNKSIIQITQDHTYVNELLKNGSITIQQAKIHPQKHMITRALGGDIDIYPDFYQIEIKEKDIFILCTDGLYSEVEEDKICELAIKNNTMSSLSNELIKLANKNGGNDNITVVCLKIGTGGAAYE
ncbi:Stp1/IreP family PP2C-type Ser/Thr phosphatase [Anaerovorax odorimutans]|uniref:Stp1/IreP family PP2C-type Ser/Thr phosphatase n=1 Tax=Anaerovorax odorimutans TaxID=109327 RepID=UPI000417BDDB|nr:Stp1/IreP family PP2C-type Ser/Thr phosphatase [Anaerovorax odorimutans]